MRVKYCLLFIVLYVSFAESLKTNLIKFIAEFLAVETDGRKILSYLCWEKSDLLQFSKRLWNEKYPINFKNAKNNFDLMEVNHQVILIDFNCNNFDDILNQANSLNLFRSPNIFIILGKVDDVLNKNLFFPLESKVYIFENISSEAYKVVSPYKLLKSSENYIQDDIGKWDNHTIETNYHPLHITRKRSNLKMSELTLSYVFINSDSVNHIWDYRDNHIDAIAKLNYILFDFIIGFLNATKVEVFQKSWGYRKPNSTLYDGMMGDLQTHVADLGGTPSFFTSERLPIADFIASTYRTYMKFIFRSPPLSHVSNIFALPFASSVWFSTLMMLLVNLLALFAISSWESRCDELKMTSDNNGALLDASVSEIALIEVSAITQQGYDAEPKSIAGRMTLLFMFFAFLFLYTSYSANIVVMLQSTSDVIKNHEDLLKFRIKLGVEDIVYSRYYFPKIQDPLRKKIVDQKIFPKGQKENFMSIVEGIKRVRNDFFAFHVELSNGFKLISDTFTEQEKCGLQIIKFINLMEPWVCIQKNSSYRELIRVGFRRIQENGMQNREASRIYVKKPKCHTGGTNFQSTGLIDVYFAMVLFWVGILVCILIFIVEVIIKRYQKHRN